MKPTQSERHMSPEYHAAHLAFSRAGIVEAAANQEPILAKLSAYTADVLQAERERIQAVLDADLISDGARINRIREVLWP